MHTGLMQGYSPVSLLSFIWSRKAASEARAMHFWIFKPFYNN